jgi:hypothetical protein
LLQQNQDQRLAAYVVWVPELRAQLKDVASATALVPDHRAKHYWDPDEIVGIKYGRVLKIDRPAWDVYMLFPTGTVWNRDEPPQPNFWMHQLGGVTNAPRLDPDEFAKRAAQLLNTKQQQV